MRKKVLQASRGGTIGTKKAEFWADALLISQEPWAAGLNMPGASPTECNLLYNKMYEFPNFPQQA